MGTFKIWLSAARLRTLPLSLAGIITGTALANLQGESDVLIFVLCLLITIAFQVTSNFANDYGDGVKGTDSSDRIGPKRAIQSGTLTPKQLRKAVFITSLISLVMVVVLLQYVFGWEEWVYFLIFLMLGGLSIWAAVKYTVGESAYGYRGLGDVFVFVFFGFLAVLGTKFLYTENLTWADVLPATAIGLLCVGVLNLNNLRDINSDTNHRKQTLVVKIGFKNGKRYHYFLLVLSFISFVLFWLIARLPIATIVVCMVPYLFVCAHLVRVMNTEEPIGLDSELKNLAISTFLLSLLFYFTVNYFL